MFFKYLENHKFLAFSHRGGALKNKENTIDAFQKSIEIGYQYIETDVQCTKDDRLIIFHDNDLLRINNQNIKISEILYWVISIVALYETFISFKIGSSKAYLFLMFFFLSVFMALFRRHYRKKNK